MYNMGSSANVSHYRCYLVCSVLGESLGAIQRVAAIQVVKTTKRTPQIYA